MESRLAHPDLNELVNALIPFAQQMLAQRGEFVPFGAKMSAAGEVSAVAGYTGSERAPSQEVIDLLAQGCREQARRGELRATGICFDVRIVLENQTEKTDAICARLEHQTGEAVDVFLPYRKGWFGRIVYGDVIASPGKVSIFGAQS